MKDIEIIKLIKDCNQEVKEDILQRFDNYNKSISLLFTNELSDVKESIKILDKKVSEQNSSVRSIAEWKILANNDINILKKSKINSRINRRSTWIFIISQIVFITMLALGWYFSNKKDITTTDTKRNSFNMEVKK